MVQGRRRLLRRKERISHSKSSPRAIGRYHLALLSSSSPGLLPFQMLWPPVSYCPGSPPGFAWPTPALGPRARVISAEDFPSLPPPSVPSHWFSQHLIPRVMFCTFRLPSHLNIKPHQHRAFRSLLLPVRRRDQHAGHSHVEWLCSLIRA